MKELNEVNNTSQYLYPPNNTPQILINPNIQERIIEQVLLQSGGVGLGFILAFLGALAVGKWFGVGTVFNSWMEKLESGTDSLKELARALTGITEELKDNHLKYLEDHEDILKDIAEVKDIVKTDVVNLLKDIERKITK
jgi:hypothetical protein